MGAMKSFKHILMSHEIFLKIFDGTQNIFLCSPLEILIFKLRESENKNIRTRYQGDLIKVRYGK